MRWLHKENKEKNVCFGSFVIYSVKNTFYVCQKSKTVSFCGTPSRSSMALLNVLCAITIQVYFRTSLFT